MKLGKPFEPGNSFGRGRPKGSKNQATLEREALLSEFGSAILKKCISEALKGRDVPMRLCMERLAPPARHQAIAFKLPSIRTPADVSRASAAVWKAVSDGNITIEDAEALMRVLEAHQRLAEVGEIHHRIEALECRATASAALEPVRDEDVEDA
jgi:hypothetical protein